MCDMYAYQHSKSRETDMCIYVSVDGYYCMCSSIYMLNEKSHHILSYHPSDDERCELHRLILPMLLYLTYIDSFSVYSKSYLEPLSS